MNDLLDNASDSEPPATPPAAVDPCYWRAARDALLIQSPLMLFAAVLLDGGYIFRVFCAASIAFWIGTTIMVIRRPNPAHASDLFFIRFGYLSLVAVAMAAAVVIHRFAH